MPLIGECPSAASPEQFCLALKAARERKGITLDHIADTTKIPAYLFHGLERNDLHRWPTGFFRRSFFRDYVRAIGLPVGETCDEFVRWFPDDAGREPGLASPPAEVATRAQNLRLMLDETWHGPRASILLRLVAASCDAAAVIGMAGVLAWMAHTDLLASTGVVSLAYLVLGTMLFGESPAKFIIAGRKAVIDALSYALGSADSDTAGPVEESPSREWITDARRVGPPPRLRVRIKVSH